MRWNSIGEFFAMGGYGLYVWGAYGAVALLMLSEALIVRAGHRAALGRVGDTDPAEAPP